MSLWILVYFIIHQCEGLGTSPIKSENDVGVIRLLQPTFTGRNVTFSFTPSTPAALGDIQWKYMNGSVGNTIERDNKQFIMRNDGKSSFLIILHADKSLNGIFVYTSNNNNERSKLIGLYLKDYTISNGCGEMYLLSEKPFFSGENLSFGYFPSPEVAKWKNVSKYSIELVNSNNDDHTSILQTHGVLELHQVGHEYIFTLFNVKKNTHGNAYRVQCSNTRFPKISNTITVSVKGMPVIGPLTNISTCRECIVFKAGESLAQVYCTTDGEYDDANVTFKIGLIAFSSARWSMTKFGLQSREKPSDDMHRLNAVCTVSGIYRNISVEAQIYVVEIPEGPPHLSASQVLLKGEAVDITCTSSKARPPPRLKLFVEKSEIVTNVSSAFDNKTGLYKSVLKLHTFQKEWGNNKMWCQQLPEIDYLYTTYMSNEIRVEYKYPPLQLNLEVIDQGNSSKELAVRCSALDSYPGCNIAWESSIENFKYTLHQYLNLTHTSISTIHFNVTDADFGKQIKCWTECPDFLNTVSNSTTVIFAKMPNVVIHSSSVLPVPTNTHLALTCAANAYPYGNITWTLMKASNTLSSHVKLCFDSSTCTYEMTTSDVEQEYLCIAKNEHGSDRGSIIVTIHKEGPIPSGRGSILWILLSGIAVVTLGFIVLVLCVCRKRWYRGNTLYEDVNIHRDDHHTYQGIAVPSSNRPHESDATLSPVIYDEIDENNSSTAQAGTNRTASETENRQCLSENSNPYANVSKRNPTGTQMTEMPHYYSESNILESVIRETNA